MNKLITVFFLVLSSLFGQTHDLSFWTRSTAGSVLPIPWYIYSGKKVVIDIRHNFDAKDTFGACLGRRFGGEALSLVPEACWYIGKADGFGPELLVSGNRGRLSLFSQNQYVQGIESRDSFLYHWTDTLVKIHKNVLLGVDWQVFRLTGKQEEGASKSTTAIDVGPATKIVLGKIYLRAWPCWGIDPKDPARRGNPTLFLGVGYVW